MPNHITNVLFITGNKKIIKELMAKIYCTEKAKEKTWNHEIGDEYPVIDFNGTVPSPKEFENTTSPPQNSAEKKFQAELTKKYGAGNWYEWNIKNWGTKWGAYDAEPVENIPDGMKLVFLTAWSSPTGWLARTARLYPSLKFEDCWKDEGGGCGRLTCVKDTVTEETIPDHDWYYQFDSAYKEEYDFIAKGKYKEVLDRYQNESEMNYHMLSKPLLDRIENKDLPLFINFEWFDLKDEFESRLKQGKEVTRKIRWKEKEV